MPYITVAMVGRPPATEQGSTLGEVLTKLGIDADQTTFRANGEQVDLDYAPTDPVTVVGAKNLVGA